jgi:hypothetical protein
MVQSSGFNGAFVPVGEWQKTPGSHYMYKNLYFAPNYTL